MKVGVFLYIPEQAASQNHFWFVWNHAYKLEQKSHFQNSSMNHQTIRDHNFSHITPNRGGTTPMGDGLWPLQNCLKPLNIIYNC